MINSNVEFVKLVELAKSGDKNAFSSLSQEMKYKLYKTGMAILKNDDDTCDAIQETLFKAYRSIETLNNPEFFSTWITRILINKCYDILRKNNKIVHIDDQVSFKEESYYDVYANESVLEGVLNKIDKDLKMVTVLYYYDELPVKDISEILNIPEGTVKSRLSRARNRIYDILIEEGGAENG